MQNPKTYQWVIAATCGIYYSLGMGFGAYTAGLYIVPVTEHFGFSRGDFALTFTLSTAISSLLQLAFGFFARRIGLRAMIITGTVLGPLAYWSYATASSLFTFYAASVFFGVSFAVCSITSVSILINNWFGRGQGTVLGVISASGGLAGALSSLIIGREIALNGYQSAYFLTAAVFAAAVLPVAFLIRSHPPGQTGSGQTSPAAAGLSIRDFAGSPAMRMAALAVFLMGFVIAPVWINTPAYLVEKGWSQLFAAGVYSALMLTMAATRIFIGFVDDKAGSQASLFLCLGSFVAGTVLLILADREWLIWVHVLFAGIGISTLSVLIPLFARAHLGRANYTAYLGVFTAIQSAGMGLGSPAANYVYDLTGTYTWVIAAFVMLGLVALALGSASLKKRPAAGLIPVSSVSPEVGSSG